MFWTLSLVLISPVGCQDTLTFPPTLINLLTLVQRGCEKEESDIGSKPCILWAMESQHGEKMPSMFPREVL